MATAMRRVPLLAILAAACALLCSHSALGHGGGLHRWTFRPEVLASVPTASVRTDLHARVATCANFTVLNLTALTPSSFTLPWFPAVSNFTLAGSIEVYSYLGNNCTSSINAALFPYLHLSRSIPQGTQWVSRPVGVDVTALGYGFEGTCASPGNLYRNNVTLQDNRFNMAWWGAPADSVVGQGMNMSDIYPGVLWGTAPNAWFFRNSSAVDRMRSIVVFTQGGPSFCCNVQYDANYSDAALMQRGSNCTASGDRRMARSAKLSKLLM